MSAIRKPEPQRQLKSWATGQWVLDGCSARRGEGAEVWKEEGTKSWQAGMAGAGSEGSDQRKHGISVFTIGMKQFDSARDWAFFQIPI